MRKKKSAECQPFTNLKAPFGEMFPADLRISWKLSLFLLELAHKQAFIAQASANKFILLTCAVL
jgi:hypothetical protein